MSNLEPKSNYSKTIDPPFPFCHILHISYSHKFLWVSQLACKLTPLEGDFTWILTLWLSSFHFQIQEHLNSTHTTFIPHSCSKFCCVPSLSFMLLWFNVWTSFVSRLSCSLDCVRISLPRCTISRVFDPPVFATVTFACRFASVANYSFLIYSNELNWHQKSF